MLIFFLSIESVEYVSHCKSENSIGLYQLTVLSDGRICAGGAVGYCATFKPPQDVEGLIGEHAVQMYPKWRAILELWKKVQNMEIRYEFEVNEKSEMEHRSHELENKIEEMGGQLNEQEERI